MTPSSSAECNRSNERANPPADGDGIGDRHPESNREVSRLEMQSRSGMEELSGALAGGEERYRRLFEAAQHGIVLTSPSGEILDCNPALCRLTGYDREELVGMQASRLYDDESREKLVHALQDTGQVNDLRMSVRRKDDEELLCLVSAILWTDDDGTAKAVQSFVQDVTQETRARQALIESAEKFRALAENTPIGVAFLQGQTVDEWALTYANPAFASVFGYAPNEIVGRSPVELCHPEDWSRLREWLHKRQAGEGENRLQARARTKSGQTRHVEVFGGRLHHQGKPALVGGVVDITEHRRLQQELLRVQEQERRSLGRDLHDGVASQLTAVTMMLSTLKSKIEDEHSDISERLHRVLELVQDSTEDVRKISRGLRPSALSDQGLLKDLEQLAKTTRGCVLEVDDGIDDLSSLCSEEKTHLYRIAQEAVANARRHADADVIRIRLSREDDGTLTFAVEDDGEGFEIGDIEQAGPEQSGFGLHSMRHRAEFLQADFSVETAPGEGTCVRCQLPG